MLCMHYIASSVTLPRTGHWDIAASEIGSRRTAPSADDSISIRKLEKEGR